jgi:hypothetical protein
MPAEDVKRLKAMARRRLQAIRRRVGDRAEGCPGGAGHYWQAVRNTPLFRRQASLAQAHKSFHFALFACVKDIISMCPTVKLPRAS